MITQSCTSKRRLSSAQQIPSHEISGAPYGTRTRVSAVKGRCPRPLDEGRAKGAGYRELWRERQANGEKSAHHRVPATRGAVRGRKKKDCGAPVRPKPIRLVLCMQQL